MEGEGEGEGGRKGHAAKGTGMGRMDGILSVIDGGAEHNRATVGHKGRVVALAGWISIH